MWFSFFLFISAANIPICHIQNMNGRLNLSYDSDLSHCFKLSQPLEQKNALRHELVKSVVFMTKTTITNGERKRKKKKNRNVLLWLSHFYLVVTAFDISYRNNTFAYSFDIILRYMHDLFFFFKSCVVVNVWLYCVTHVQCFQLRNIAFFFSRVLMLRSNWVKSSFAKEQKKNKIF